MPIEGMLKDCFLNDLEKVKAMSGRSRWRCLRKKQIYEWDSLHFHIEVYNDRGRHLGVLDQKGTSISDAVNGRRINV